MLCSALLCSALRCAAPVTASQPESQLVAQINNTCSRGDRDETPAPALLLRPSDSRAQYRRRSWPWPRGPALCHCCCCDSARSLPAPGHRRPFRVESASFLLRLFSFPARAHRRLSWFVSPGSSDVSPVHWHLGPGYAGQNATDRAGKKRPAPQRLRRALSSYRNTKRLNAPCVVCHRPLYFSAPKFVPKFVPGMGGVTLLSAHFHQARPRVHRHF